MTTITMGGKYIRRCDLDDFGRPVEGATPVQIVTTTLDPPFTIGWQHAGRLRLSWPDGTTGSVGKHAYDLLPWPEPPVIVPWETRADFPSGALFRTVIDPQWEFYMQEIYTCDFGSVSVRCADSSIPIADMLHAYEHSLDNGKTWLPCGKMKAVSNEG